MTPKQITQVLKPLGILHSINLYGDEPTPSFHCVSVKQGSGQQAIDAINSAGGRCVRVPACSNIYGDNLFVARKDPQ